jgi:hypothetical protein
MLSTLALIAALSATPGQGKGLTLSEGRLTHGIFGPTRTKNAFLPGDSVFVAFDINGITVDKQGKVLYSTAVEVTDAKGNVVFRQPARDQEAVISLGGGELPGYAQVDIGLEQPKGDYMVNVTVTDRTTKQSKTISQKFTVLPLAFGVVRGSLTRDPEGRLPAGLLMTGQGVFLNFAVVGFARDKKNKELPHVDLELRILDEKGNPTTALPLPGSIKADVPSKAVLLPAQYFIALNRPGKYTVQLKASCKVCGASLTESFPLIVNPHLK